MRSRVFILFCGLCMSPALYAISATPWLTGPLLAPAGHTIPKGHSNFEMYGLDINTFGHFDEFGQYTPSPLTRALVPNPVFTHGYTDWMDIQLSIPYVFNSTLGINGQHLADVGLAVGFQLIEQKDSFWKPDLRFAVQEIFPTGRFEDLNPEAAGTDATGLGSYQTQLAFNFQRLSQIKNHHLRTRLSLSCLFFSPVHVHGLNSFGGQKTSEGFINMGMEKDADLAFEFTVTQHWVLVMEGYVSSGPATRFNGVVKLPVLNASSEDLGAAAYYEEALAPAIEYNFTPNIGLIGGVWFPVKSINTAKYMTYVLALNAYW